MRHVLAAEGVGEPVVDHRVERLGVAHPVAEARLLEQVWRLRHRLHSAADADLEVAGADRLVEDADPADAGCADLVDGLRGDLLRDPAFDLGLALGNLALAGLEHLAEDHVLDLVALTSARSSAASIAVPPRSVASSVDRPPPSFPNGVRAVPMIAVLGI